MELHTYDTFFPSYFVKSQHLLCNSITTLQSIIYNCISAISLFPHILLVQVYYSFMCQFLRDQDGEQWYKRFTLLLCCPSLKDAVMD